VRDYSKVFGHTVRAEDREAMRVRYPPVEHPVVRVHLDTGRRMRFVDRSFADHVVGLDRDGSDTLIDLLASEAETVKYHCRFAGSEHAVTFWDSRSTQLHASSDDWPRRRVMERASVAGGDHGADRRGRADAEAGWLHWRPCASSSWELASVGSSWRRRWPRSWATRWTSR
jgi:alpha-ketoglutarate-dependent taurine dioxygenase